MSDWFEGEVDEALLKGYIRLEKEGKLSTSDVRGLRIYRLERQLAEATAENEKLRAEVAACDGHGYLRDEISGLKKLLSRTLKLLPRPWMERGGVPTVTFDEWEALLTEIDAALGEQEKA